MFFQVLFIIVICLAIFLFASWFFSCLYNEWQLDAAERARRKQEEELQVVKEQDPDGTEETNFIEETSINIDDVTQDKKNRKQAQQAFVQMGDATLPSNQVLCSVYSQGNDSNGKKKSANSQKQNQVQYAQIQQQPSQMKQQQQQQQYPNLIFQDFQQQQLQKQMQQQAVQQRQIEQIKQQFPNITASDIRNLQAHLQQANLNSVNNNINNNNVNNNVNNNSVNSNSNSVQINVSNNKPINTQQVTAVAAEIPTTVDAAVEIVVEPETKIQAIQTEQPQKIIETVTAEVEKDVLPEIVQTPQESTNKQLFEQTKQDLQQRIKQQQQVEHIQHQIQMQSNQQPAVSVISEEDIIKELNLQDKLPYRERKLEEYEFFKTALEIIDLSRESVSPDGPFESYANEFEEAIDEADAKRSKINWTLVPSLHATEHISAIEEIAVLLEQFLHSKFFKKINRQEKMLVIDQLLRSVLSTITKRLKCPAKKQDHQEDLLFVWNEIKDLLEKEKIRIKTPKSNKPGLPPKPQKPNQFMNV